MVKHFVISSATAVTFALLLSATTPPGSTGGIGVDAFALTPTGTRTPHSATSLVVKQNPAPLVAPSTLSQQHQGLSRGISAPVSPAHSSTVLHANLIDRFTRVAKANINNALKNLEDPEKVMDQAVEDMERDLLKIRQSYAEINGTQRRLVKQKQQYDSVANDWYKRAQLALVNGNESLAREALSRRQHYTDEAETVQLQIDAQAKSLDKLYEGIQLLESKILEARAKKGELAARARKAKTLKQVNEMVSGLTAEANGLLAGIQGKNGAVDAFKRMEEKVEALEAAAEASAEMAELVGQLPGGEERDLEQQFRMLEGSAAVDDELTKLKQDLKLLTGQPTATGVSSSKSSYGSIPSKSIDDEIQRMKKVTRIPVSWD